MIDKNVVGRLAIVAQHDPIHSRFHFTLTQDAALQPGRTLELNSYVGMAIESQEIELNK